MLVYQLLNCYDLRHLPYLLLGLLFHRRQYRAHLHHHLNLNRNIHHYQLMNRQQNRNQLNRLSCPVLMYLQQ